jgi:hypothetical protein
MSVRSNVALLLTSGLSDRAGSLRSLALRYDSLAAELWRWTARKRVLFRRENSN